MRPPRTIKPVTCALVAGLVMVCACSTTRQIEAEPDRPVRRVVHDGTPPLEHLARHARAFGDEMYPRLCALLLDESASPPRQFDVVFKPLKSGNLGEANTRRARILMNASSFTNHAGLFEKFNKVYAHEMAHLAAQHGHWALPFWNSSSPAEKYWGESIADYARFKLLGTDGWQGAECNSRYPHYTDGYGCGGAFLLFIEAGHGTNVVRDLVRELRQKSYSDSFFDRLTGKSVEQWWSEFQATPAFRPGAAAALKLRDAIGYRNGRPPKDVVARFQRYVEMQKTNQAEPPAFQLQYDASKPPPVEFLMQAYIYGMQPGGPAEVAVRDLFKRGALPGFSEGDKAHPLASGSVDEFELQDFPKTKMLRVRKEGDDSVFVYRMASPSLEQGWKLEAATRQAADGQVLEEFPVN